ncbi:MAG: hypothetical protein KA105_00360 [Caulobacter sp.]|nr:hypothetical protein [Caulobacter sp.]
MNLSSEPGPGPRPSTSRLRQRPVTTVIASAFTIAVVALGYALLGLLPALLFAFGFVAGLALWIALPGQLPFAAIRWPYFITLGLFALHKIEERQLDFFPALSKLTGSPMPDTSSPLVYALYAMAGAWLLIPVLLRRRILFGAFLAWTFFAAMGLVELAHFVFPFLTPKPVTYFPGLATATMLVPAGWWGLWRTTAAARSAQIRPNHQTI